MSCNSFTSWEIQDNLKLRSVVTEKVVQKTPDSQSSNAAEGNEVKLSDIGVPEHSVTLRPFLHPELTDSSRDACELRLHCEPHHNLSICRVTVVATARNTELYDRKGEYLQTVRGLNIPGTDWYRFLYCSGEPCYEIKLKFLSLMQPGSLSLGSVAVHLENHTWPAQLANPAAAQSVPSLLERLSEVELSPHARSVLNLLYAANQQQQQQQQPQPQQQFNSRHGAAAGNQQQQQQQQSLAAIGGLRVWLESRLDAMENRLNQRLDRMESQLAILTAKAAAASAAADEAKGDCE